LLKEWARKGRIDARGDRHATANTRHMVGWLRVIGVLVMAVIPGGLLVLAAFVWARPSPSG